MPHLELEDGGLAIFIGINTYTNQIPQLNTAAKDAQILAKLLRERYNYKVLELLNTDATFDTLKDLLENLKHKQIRLPDRLLQVSSL